MDHLPGDGPVARLDVVAATLPSDAPDPPEATPAGVQATLDAVARAFLAADPDALRRWLHDPDGTFGRRWLERAGNLAGVPLSRYRLTVDPSLPDLATGRVRARYGAPAVVVAVTEEHALEGFDTAPARADLYLTLVHSDDGWRVASDAEAEPLGLVSADHLWDHGPVIASTAGPLLALHHPATGDVDGVLRALDDARAVVRERWPLPWPEPVVVIVPRDEDELAALLHVTFDLSQFVAFATATPTSELGRYELTGSRVLLNPARFSARTAEVRRSILVHELLHVATRSHAGPLVPSWLDEGVAQALGEQRSTTGTQLLDALVRAGRPVTLPPDAAFVTGGRQRIQLSYQLAWSFVDHLRARYGTERVARFYAAVGAGAIGQPGTEAWHVERGAREVFGAGLSDLTTSWQGG